MEWDVDAAVAALKKLRSSRVRDGMARFALPSDHALGVSVPDVRALAKRIGPDHALALALWKSGIYEARMLTAFIAEPERITPALMDRWCRDFDSWGICDALCFHLFDRTPHAWTKVAQWSDDPREFVKRAAFAVLAGLAVHDKTAPDEAFVRTFRFIERAASDDRNFVKKAVSWALRGIGKRNGELNSGAVELARRLAAASDAAPRWVGRDALRELTSAAVLRRLQARRQ
ncbi:MAG TPA: DNA alkylation repair protein [Chthoniobacterales bacterium]